MPKDSPTNSEHLVRLNSRWIVLAIWWAVSPHFFALMTVDGALQATFKQREVLSLTAANMKSNGDVSLCGKWKNYFGFESAFQMDLSVSKLGMEVPEDSVKYECVLQRLNQNIHIATMPPNVFDLILERRSSEFYKQVDALRPTSGAAIYFVPRTDDLLFVSSTPFRIVDGRDGSESMTTWHRFEPPPIKSYDSSLWLIILPLGTVADAVAGPFSWYLYAIANQHPHGAEPTLHLVIVWVFGLLLLVLLMMTTKRTTRRKGSE